MDISSNPAIKNNHLKAIDLNNIDLKIQKYISSSKSFNTKRAYQSDWVDFENWCAENQLISLPAAENTIILYISTLAESGMKMSTIQRRITSISIAHQAKGFSSPTYGIKTKTVWKGIRNEYGVVQVGKAPILVKDLRRMVMSLPGNIQGLRDRALLLVGFAGAFRRSELVALNIDNVEFVNEGLIILIKHSKTDQEGVGRKVGIAYGSHLETCPVRTLRKWIEESKITDGPLFRKINKFGLVEKRHLCDKSVALIVKRSAESAGLDSSIYSAHSLRAGLATSAAVAGVSEWSIMQQTGHKSVEMVRRYIRDGNLFRDNASAQIGL